MAIENWVFSIGAVGTLVLGAIALFNYLRSVKVRRAEWLLTLFEKFYENDQYKEIRKILDYGPKQELAQLQDAVEKEKHTGLVEKLYDYLNFFEFIVTLKDNKQLKHNEILDIFEYYLKDIRKYDFVISKLDTLGYEKLDRFLTEMKS